MMICNKLGSNYISSEQLKAFLLSGFLGGYTTFSSFSIETVSLIKSGEMLHAILYIIASLVLCVGSSFLGLALGKYVSF
jgi:CrcB protein